VLCRYQALALRAALSHTRNSTAHSMPRTRNRFSSMLDQSSSPELDELFDRQGNIWTLPERLMGVPTSADDTPRPSPVHRRVGASCETIPLLFFMKNHVIYTLKQQKSGLHRRSRLEKRVVFRFRQLEAPLRRVLLRNATHLRDTLFVHGTRATANRGAGACVHHQCVTLLSMPPLSPCIGVIIT
jgi:hypothetical protein